MCYCCYNNNKLLSSELRQPDFFFNMYYIWYTLQYSVEEICRYITIPVLPDRCVRYQLVVSLLR